MKNAFGKSCLPWLLLTACVFDQASAQTGPYVTISGQVKDVVSGEPLPGVNVFLVNTTRGAATDQNGFYAIPRVPLGAYELFASLVGYESQKRTLRLVQTAELQIDFNFKAKPFELGQVEVVAAPALEWKKNLRKFEALFWGRNYDAAQCTILNPEVLDFTVEEASQCLTAIASQPLQLENRMLGYRIHLVLEDFRHCPGKKEQVRYSVKPQFDELAPANAKEQKKWKENRRKIYHGSFRHFLAALASGRLEEEGFWVYNVASFAQRRHGQPIAPENFISPGILPSEKKLHFKDYLKVIYIGKYVVEPPISWMSINRDSITVNAAGYVHEDYAVVLYGRWFSQRLAGMLPRDYQPF
jgi:hypothetical protein